MRKISLVLFSLLFSFSIFTDELQERKPKILVVVSTKSAEEDEYQSIIKGAVSIDLQNAGFDLLPEQSQNDGMIAAIQSGSHSEIFEAGERISADIIITGSYSIQGRMMEITFTWYEIRIREKHQSNRERIIINLALDESISTIVKEFIPDIQNRAETEPFYSVIETAEPEDEVTAEVTDTETEDETTVEVTDTETEDEVTVEVTDTETEDEVTAEITDTETEDETTVEVTDTGTEDEVTAQVTDTETEDETATEVIDTALEDEGNITYFEFSAGFSPVVYIGKLREYTIIGYHPTIESMFYSSTRSGDWGVGLSAGLELFSLEALNNTYQYLIPMAITGAYKSPSEKIVHYFAHLSVGLSIFVVNSEEKVLIKPLWSFSGESGIDLQFLDFFGMKIIAGFNFFMLEDHPVMGLAPGVWFSFRV